MESNRYFTIKKPDNSFLSTIIDYYFYVEASVEELRFQQEVTLPFPRLNFLYFFEHPFLITNEALGESIELNMVISRMTTDIITIKPTGDRVKIIGAHILPHGLAFFTKVPISQMPWIINTKQLFGNIAVNFEKKIAKCNSKEQMFYVVEKTFLDNLIAIKLPVVTPAIEMIENLKGDVFVNELAEIFKVSDRTIRNHFYEYLGCSPKEYIRLVKLKNVAYQMKHTEYSLTDIAHENNFADQAHFINEIKNVTGMQPKQLKKEIPDFRFLQF